MMTAYPGRPFVFLRHTETVDVGLGPLQFLVQTDGIQIPLDEILELEKRFVPRTGIKSLSLN